MGLTPNVTPGAPIVSTWGNTIRDRTVQSFATAAERSAQWIAPPEGAISYLVDTDSLWYYTGTAWAGLRAVVPSGTVYATGGATAGGGFWGVIMGGSKDLRGGMAFTASGGSGLQVPVAGLYHVDAQLKLQPAAAGLISSAIGVNNAVVKYGGQETAGGTLYPTMVATALLQLAANDVLNLMYSGASGGTNFQIDANAASNYISAALVSL